MSDQAVYFLSNGFLYMEGPLLSLSDVMFHFNITTLDSNLFQAFDEILSLNRHFQNYLKVTTTQIIELSKQLENSHQSGRSSEASRPPKKIREHQNTFTNINPYSISNPASNHDSIPMATKPTSFR